MVPTSKTEEKSLLLLKEASCSISRFHLGIADQWQQEKSCRWLCFWKTSVWVFTPYASRQLNFADMSLFISLELLVSTSNSVTCHFREIFWVTHANSIPHGLLRALWQKSNSCFAEEMRKIVLPYWSYVYLHTLFQVTYWHGVLALTCWTSWWLRGMMLPCLDPC